MYVEARSETANTITATKIRSGFFLPKNTAASAVHPFPAAMPGTQEESLALNEQPVIPAINAASTQPPIL